MIFSPQNEITTLVTFGSLITFDEKLQQCKVKENENECHMCVLVCWFLIIFVCLFVLLGLCSIQLNLHSL